MQVKGDQKFIDVPLPYRIFPPSLDPTIWPIVIVEIPQFKDPVNQDIYALIDSGANNSILDKQIAERMKIDLSKCKKFKNGRSVNSFYEYWILNEPVHIKVAGVEFPVIFNVIDTDDTMWPMILGEDSIFKYSQLIFKKYKKEFIIKFLTNIN